MSLAIEPLHAASDTECEIIVSAREVSSDWTVCRVSANTLEAKDAGSENEPASQRVDIKHETVGAIVTPQTAVAPVNDPPPMPLILNEVSDSWSLSTQPLEAALSIQPDTQAGIRKGEKSPLPQPSADAVGASTAVVDKLPRPGFQQLQYQVRLNGVLQPTVPVYSNSQQQILVHYPPLATLLEDQLLLDAASEKVKYQRSRDGAAFELSLQNGKVSANGRSVGFLKEFTLIDTEQALFPLNALQVFSGLHIRKLEQQRIIDMELDSRLRYITGFELYVNGQRLPFLQPEPRAVGHVLLLPLRAVVDELGSTLSLSADGNTVSIFRTQDNATISLNLLSGLVRANDKPVGTSANIAYADREQLLLPKDAVAALTGTHVTIVPGSRRIDVDLDDHLAGIIKPGDSIFKQASRARPTLETVESWIDSESEAGLIASGYYDQYNMRLRYETPSIEGQDGLTPDWLQLSAESIKGWGMSVGDQSINHRELEGTGGTHVRGLYAYKPEEKGVVLGVAGTQRSGSRTLANGESIPDFNATVAGLRYLQNDGSREIGVALESDPEQNSDAVYLSHRRTIKKDHKTLGTTHQRINLLGGLFDRQDTELFGTVASWDASMQPDEHWSLSARAGYSSAQFFTSIDEDDDATDETDSSESLDADRMTYGINSSYDTIASSSIGLSHTATEYGLLQGRNNKAWNHSSQLSLSTRPWRNRWLPWLYGSIQNTEQHDQASIVRRSAEASWHWQEYRALLKHSDQQQRGQQQGWLTSLEFNRNAWQRYLANGSSLKLAPRASLWRDNRGDSATLGGLLGYDSGGLLGPYWRFNASYGKNLAVRRLEQDDETSQDGADYANMNLRYNYRKLLSLRVNYFTDLDGNDDFYATLGGKYEFNPPRNMKFSRPNAGLLKGQVFLDRNFDGIRQHDETGIAGVRVQIKGTRVGLNADPGGRFTIQNLPVGIYRVEPDLSRLPLGYTVQPGRLVPVKIGDGLISEMQIPIVQGSRLSGAVYVDLDNNGQLDRNDQRLENVGLQISAEAETASTLFGQYTFDFLPPGEYEIAIQTDTLPDGIRPDPQQSLKIRLQPGLKNELNVRLLKQAP